MPPIPQRKKMSTGTSTDHNPPQAQVKTSPLVSKPIVLKPVPKEGELLRGRCDVPIPDGTIMKREGELVGKFLVSRGEYNDGIAWDIYVQHTGNRVRG